MTATALSRPDGAAPADPPAGPAVRLHDVSFGYGRDPVVHGLDLRVEPGEVLALLGPNGAGKSTTIGLLLGLLTPAAGRVSLFGLGPEQAVRRGLVAAMLQENQLLPRATVGELLHFTRGLYREPMSLDEVAGLADVGDLLGRTTDGLSGGQAQRVRFALAVVGRPSLLVLDEPTAALDVRARREFWRAIDGYAAHGRAVLFASHHLQEVDEHAGRVVMLAAGRIVADGSPAQIRRTVADRTVAVDVTRDGPDEAMLRTLPGVASATVAAGRAELRCTDADAAVTALAERGLLRNIEVGAGSLEDAFLSITEVR
ncbi:ABC transporter ATP-binding protein [Amorphoplanes nipponensis]|uniref:ABC transporter ATP-binding protein n=1 Tax=Actinoplanes nipponensis TaxID=135950 RepID=A0A919MJE0_9ACTN|nr:ABC transporter ATP-binding protein [Actinoplanes nipponensis]GIE47361.1 ABC transporter ATP-binding protein [Actinoplanes nipponensis]